MMGNFIDIDVTNLDSAAKEYLVGLQDNGTANFGLNLDPSSASHVFLDGAAGGTRYWWAVGCSDGTAAPTEAAGLFVLPATRTWFTFYASVQQFQRAFATDDAVRINGSVRVSGAITMTPKT